jgi:hypothetical protein
MRSKIIFPLALLSVLVIAACGMLLSSCGKTRVEKKHQEAAAPSPDSLDARVRLNAGSYAVREPIVMTLIVRNTTDRTLNLTFPTAQRYDFIVRKGQHILWQWGHERMFAQVIGRLALAPRDSITYELTWDQRTLEGTEPKLGAYSIQGILKTFPETATDERTFGIMD